MSLPMPEVFCNYKHYYDTPSNRFGDELKGERWNIGIHNHIKEIINYAIGIGAHREVPSKCRPEKSFRCGPHAVFKQMKKTSTGYLEYMRIFAQPVAIITQQSDNKTERKCMTNNTTISNGLGKDHPADQLIENVWQKSSEGYVAVVKTAFEWWENVLKYEENTECDSEMTENEHCRMYTYCGFKGVLFCGIPSINIQL